MNKQRGSAQVLIESTNGHPTGRAERCLTVQGVDDRSYVEDAPPETAANTLICLIHQANYLLDRPVCSVPVRAYKETPYGVTTSGFTEQLYSARRQHRESPPHRSYGSHRSNQSHRSGGPQNPTRR